MKMTTTFLKIIDGHTVIITVLALLFTFLCRQFEFVFEIPTTLIGIAVIFPLVFSISSAYRRREEALRYFASLKGHAAALYIAHRDWLPKEQDEGARGNELVHDLLTAVSDYLHADESNQGNDPHQIYRVVDAFSNSHEQLRQQGVTNSEISRANQYLRSIIIDFERMKNIARYRTPVAMRAYSSFFLSIFPIFFSPYFASVAYPDYPWVGYFIAILYSVVLVSLDNIQERLENPYDGVGADDLRLDIADAFTALIGNEGA